MPEAKVIDCMTSASEACPAADKSGMSEMIMSDLLNDRTTAEWAALYPGGTGLLNKMHEILSALLAHRLRKAEEKLMALDVVNGIGLDRSEIGPVPMDDTQKRTNGMRRKRWKNCITGE
jgi:hypothetical protein